MKNIFAIFLIALTASASAQTFIEATPAPSTPSSAQATFVISAQTARDADPSLAGAGLAVLALVTATIAGVAIWRARR